jgi:1-acyl-sn-glycerol-3-phosphate acyltransferase
MVAVLFLGLAILIFLFPRWSPLQRQNMIRRWSNWIIHIVGVRVVCISASGAKLEQFSGPFLLAANHISWLDIFVVDSIRPVNFVAKSDIKQWPLIGSLCDRAGTIFVERTRRHAVRKVLDDMADVLAKGGCVGVFPEGTTGDMRTLMPFHANLLQAAISQQTIILPIALAYVDTHGEIDLNALFTEPITFTQSVFRISGAAQTLVQLYVCEPIHPEPSLTRHRAAQLCTERINLALGRSGPALAVHDATVTVPQ